MAAKASQMREVSLTTTGRKTGQPRTVDLGAIPEGDGWIVIGSYAGADIDPSWWLNMVAKPDVTLKVDGQVIKVRMQEITNPRDRKRIWNNVVASSPGYAAYQKRTSRVIPLGWLRPVS
jgi:deazaflavin-dependent oxidoreductase (nitroreductase family)